MSVNQDLLNFIREHIRSVWALELLLLMKRAPERAFTPDELVTELRGSSMLVRNSLESFERAGLILPEDGGRVRYSPASPLLGQPCDELEDAYRQRSVAIVNAIVAPPDKLQALADAFKIKRDPK